MFFPRVCFQTYYIITTLKKVAKSIKYLVDVGPMTPGAATKRCGNEVLMRPHPAQEGPTHMVIRSPSRLETMNKYGYLLVHL